MKTQKRSKQQNTTKLVFPREVIEKIVFGFLPKRFWITVGLVFMNMNFEVSLNDFKNLHYYVNINPSIVLNYIAAKKFKLTNPKEKYTLSDAFLHFYNYKKKESKHFKRNYNHLLKNNEAFFRKYSSLLWKKNETFENLKSVGYSEQDISTYSSPLMRDAMYKVFFISGAFNELSIHPKITKELRKQLLIHMGKEIMKHRNNSLKETVEQFKFWVNFQIDNLVHDWFTFPHFYILLRMEHKNCIGETRLESVSREYGKYFLPFCWIIFSETISFQASDFDEDSFRKKVSIMLKSYEEQFLKKCLISVLVEGHGCWNGNKKTLPKVFESLKKILQGFRLLHFHLDACNGKKHFVPDEMFVVSTYFETNIPDEESREFNETILKKVFNTFDTYVGQKHIFERKKVEKALKEFNREKDLKESEKYKFVVHCAGQFDNLL